MRGMFAQTIISDSSVVDPRPDERLQDFFCPGACHEIYAASNRHAMAATSFALMIAYRSAIMRPIIWIRHEFLDREFGMPFPSGIAELGFAPCLLTLVRVPNILAALQATLEAARCGALGAVVVDLWGASKFLDHVASRRLALAAQTSGVILLMTRTGGQPQPSAAMSRWNIESGPSRVLPANTPGSLAFTLTLLRHRNGFVSRQWQLEWNRDQRCFEEIPVSLPAKQGRDNASPLSGAVVPVYFSRPPAMATA